MSGYRQIITEVVALIEEYGDSLSLQSLSDALDVPVETIRRQVRLHDVDVPIDRIGLVPEIWIEAAELDDCGDPAATSPQDIVCIGNGTDYARRVLGTERFGAAVLAPLYEAAAELSLHEPDNEVLAGATATLLRRFLPGMRPHSRFRAETIAELSRAIGSGNQVRIRYSRAWEPGVFDRVIEPYALVRTRRGIEVDAGPIHADGSIRTYLVSRILGIETLPQQFERPEDADRIAAAHREPTIVTGRVPQDREWAIRKWADEFRVVARTDEGTRFRAALLPPVPSRAGLMQLVAGPDAHFDDPDLRDAAATLAEDLLAHHDLAA